MNGNIDFEVLSEVLKDSLIEILKDKGVDEMKVLDWFAWESDFYIEKNKAVLSNVA